MNAFPAAAIARVARTSIPSLADFCLVHLLHGAEIPCVAVAHVSREGARHVRALMRRHLIRLTDSDSAVAQVVRTRRPLLRKHIYPDYDLEGEVAYRHRRLAARSALVVPIEVGGSVVGALSLCYSESGRSYAPRHVMLAQRIARSIARTLAPGARADGSYRLLAAARDARQGAPVRRRLAPRN